MIRGLGGDLGESFMAKGAVEEYLRAMSRVDEKGATEFTYRTPLDNLLRALAPAGVKIVQEPKRAEGIGAPDFRVEHGSGAVIGYVECKKPGEDLHSLSRGKQVQKYKNLSPNILLTDYWNFYLLHESAKIPPASLCGKKAEDKNAVAELLRRFLESEPQQIGDAKTLARALAERCRMLRIPLAQNLENDTGRLSAILHEFRNAIYRDIDEFAFADALAQTLVYGLLTAKLSMKNGGTLELNNVKKHIPQNFELLRGIAGFLDELEEESYADIKYLVDDVLAIINHMDAAAVAGSMSRQSKKVDGEDPYTHFYEDFLAAYNPQMREARGAYYTPPPVVRFIARAADDILRRDFGLADGLADSNVTALDFAAGTGTFMLEMFRLVFGNGGRSRRDMLARNHLLPNFFGFELLLAPFVIAHLKLSQFLKDSGVELNGKERVNVFLTNTLESAETIPALHIIPELATETKHAQEIKKRDILVIIGNPPYSGHAQTPGREIIERKHKTRKKDTKLVKAVQDTWIGKLLRDYYEMDGEPLKEKNTKWLQDDYVKFIRFAQHKVDEAGEGVFAVITNHAFLENPTFRGMRQSLMRSFNRLYFLDLHGSVRRNERAPDGGNDENVFDIQQGVAVSLFVKKKGLRNGVFHADLFGTRAHKYEWCEERSFDSAGWKEIKPAPPHYFFVPRDERGAAKYERFRPVVDTVNPDKGIFIANSVGVITARDNFALDFDGGALYERVCKFAAMPVEEAREFFELGEDSRDWKVALAQKDLQNSTLDIKKVCPIYYRPFDIRQTYYTGNSRGFHCMPRGEVMRHMLAGENLGLVTVRQVAEKEFNHVIIANGIIDGRMTLSNRGVGYLFPLYRYDQILDSVKRNENFAPEFRRWIDERYGERYAPEKILGCIYAVLHSPEYRRRYAEFLRMDFPRVPFPQDNGEFLRLAKIGEKLMDAHLLRTTFDGAKLCGDGTGHRMEKVRYDECGGRLYFNANEYFAPVPPEVWDFHIGGYRPLHKFLESRKGRVLSMSEVQTMEQAASAISFTISAQKEIDGA